MNSEGPVRGHFIGGQWVTGEPGKPRETLPVTDPATGETLATIPVGGPEQADAAVGAAVRAAPGWAVAPVGERAAMLRTLAEALREHEGELAGLQTADNGKPLPMSRGDVAAAAATLTQYAELGPLHRGRSLVGDHDATDLMVAEPYGVGAVIVPWNDPLGIAAGLVGAALVTGNTVVLKPSERAPLVLIRMVELAGGPPGVLNLLLGDHTTGAALVEHPDIDLVCHVGSVATGRAIASRCGLLMRKAVLELGGKDPLIVDAGVDPEWAAVQAATGAFANAGQMCTAVERIYVHRQIADPFLDRLVAHTRAITVGDGRAEGTRMGPLIDERQRSSVHGQVRQAVEAGARPLTGGTIPAGPGWFYPPTVLASCTDDMAVMREETFGPVAPVQVVESFDDALVLAALTEYGLAATVLTCSQEHAQRAWRTLRVGTVKINEVWGGAPGGAAEPHKHSGRGFGYGPELLDEVTTTKVVHYRPAPS